MALFRDWLSTADRILFRRAVRRFLGNLKQVPLVSLLKWALSRNGRLVKVEISGHRLTLRKGTPDFLVALSSLGTEFEPLSKLLDRGFAGTIVDAGGYIGTAAIKFSVMFPRARILTLEPHGGNFKILAENVSRYANIYPIRAALVGKKRNSVDIYDGNCGEWGFTLIDQAVTGATFNKVDQALALTLDDLDLHDIGFLKLDIEGGEKEIFDYAGPALDKVPIILVELHETILEGCRASFDTFSRFRLTEFDGVEKWYSRKIAVD